MVNGPNRFRFWTEVQASVPVHGPLKYPTPNPHDYESVPPGCYDCIDGYYNPKVYIYITSISIDGDPFHVLLNNTETILV